MNHTTDNDNKMKAAAIDQFGDTQKLQIREFPIPVCKPDEILIKLESAGVGAWDAMEREGLFAKMSGKTPRFPEILGSEGAGTIAETGENIKNFKKGDKVYSVVMRREAQRGFFAQYITVKEKEAWKIPSKIPGDQAGALPIDGGTALRGLRDTLHIKSGETVMVFGASGGIGHMAIQLAKQMGARVFAVASGDDGVRLAEKLGADKAIDGKREDIQKAASEFAPEGIDAALVTSGGTKMEEALKVLKKGGRVAYPTGVNPEPKSNEDHTVENYNANYDGELMESLNKMIEESSFILHIGHSFPLEKVAEAQQELDHHYLGRITLNTN